MKKLKPVLHKAKYEKAIQEKIDSLLYDKIFGPIFGTLKSLPKAVTKKNDGPQDALVKAIHDGQIHYENGRFYGSFNAKTSKALKDLGAKWVPTHKAYSLPAEKVPPAVKNEISKSRSIAIETTEKINKLLDIAAESWEQIDLLEDTKDVLEDVQTQIHKTTEKDVEIPVAVTGYVGQKVAQDFSENMNLYIKQWYDEEIIRLRKQVQHNVVHGFRAKEMVSAIQAEYGVSRRKAEFLARNESMLLTSTYKQAVYEEAGLKRYQWSTSQDRRTRETHKAMHGKICRWDDPTVYWNGREWVKRANIGGVELHPGKDYQCLPAESEIEVAYGIKKAFRRWHTGKMTTIVTQSGKTLRATPNHQVLTVGGWKNIGSLNDSDYIIELTDELIKSLGDNIDNGKSTIGEIFDALGHDFPVLPAESTKEDFHGDSTDSNVDIIDTNRVLLDSGKSGNQKSIKKLFLAFTNTAGFGVGKFLMDLWGKVFSNLAPFGVRCTGDKLSFGGRGPIETDHICFRSTANANASVQKTRAYDISRDTDLFSYGVLAVAGDVCRDDHLGVYGETIGRFATAPSVGLHGHITKVAGEIVSCKADNLGSFLEGHALIKKTDRVVKVLTEDFVGHVFNLETVNNWFTSNGIIIHNCRCVSIPLLEEREI